MGLCDYTEFKIYGLGLNEAAVQLMASKVLAIPKEQRDAQTADAFPTEMQSSFWQTASGRYAHLESVEGMQADSLHLALWAADNDMTTNDPFAARYDETALVAGGRIPPRRRA